MTKNTQHRSHLFCFVLALFISLSVNSKERLPLPQQGVLGLSPVTTEAGVKVKIRQVFPGTTASDLKLETDDILLTINGTEVADFSHLLTILPKITVGAPVKVAIERKGKQQVLRGIMHGRPREKSDIAEVVYDTLYWNEQRIRTVVYTPHQVLKNKQKAPAIFYLQGYTCDSVEYGRSPKVTMLQMINQFVEAGYLVYRAEKLGVGESQGTLNCTDVDFTTEVSAFVGALRELKNHPNVDPEQVYLWGHSLGVLFAPAMAQQENVAGIIGYGGVVKSWYDYIIDLYGKQSVKYFNTSKSAANDNIKTVKPFLQDWLQSDKTWQQILQNKKAIEANLIPISGQQVFSRHFTFFRDVNRYNFAKIWQELQVPTLMIHGSLDIQAMDQSWAFDIAEAVNKGGNNLGKAVVIEGAEHGLMRYGSISEYRTAQTNNEYNPGLPKDKFEPKIGEATLKWMKDIQAK